MCATCRMMRTHAVCLTCRYAAKRWRYMLGSCPFCRKDLEDAGVKAKIPKKTDNKGWRKFNEYVRSL